jgi:hypothetical protein
MMALKAGVVMVLMAMAASADAAAFYVALDGSDAGPGTAQHPFATLDRARDAVRQARARARAGAVAEPLVVFIRGGEYSGKHTLALTQEDSGTEASPTIWQSYPGEEVRFVGGRRLTGFQPVSDAATGTLPQRGPVAARQRHPRRAGEREGRDTLCLPLGPVRLRQ